MLFRSAIFGQREGELVSAALAGADALAGSVADAVKNRVVVPAGTTVMTLENADGNKVKVKTVRPLREVGWPGKKTTVHLNIGKARRSTAPGERLGSLTLQGPTGKVRTPVVAAGSLGEPSLGWRLEHLL